MVKVSIIIPVYKVEKYIERCLRSVMAQTYDGPVECILVDDCTPDRSMEIAAKTLSAYSGNIDFKIVRHDRNRGLSAARNTGIREATGEYLYFLDSDDEITPDAMEKLIQLVYCHPQIGMVIGNLYSSYCMRFLLVADNMKEYYNDSKQIKKLMLQENCLPVTAWNKLINKEFLISNHLFFEEGILHEDQLWNFFIAKVIRSVAICHTPVYIYYMNDSSIMSQVSPRRIESNLRILEIIFHNITHVQVFLQYKKGVKIGIFMLSMFLKLKNGNYVMTQLKKMQEQFKYACRDALKRWYLRSFTYLLIFRMSLLGFRLIWNFFNH